jgi:hypothetical protein
MSFIKENFELIVVLLFILLIFLSSLILSFNKYFAMYFSNKKFQIVSSSEINALNGTKDFSIQIFNKNINDIRVSGFGYVYKGQNIDFYHNFLDSRNLPQDHKIVISSRDYLSAKINMQLLKTIVSDINKGSKSVESIKTYVTDALGLTTISNSPQVRKQLHSLLMLDQNELKKAKKEQFNKHKLEERAYKKKRQIERRIRTKEFLGKLILKTRRIFKRKS